MSKIIDLGPWGLSQDNPEALTQLASAHIHLPYLGYQSVISLAPSDRIKQIAAHYRQAYRQLIALLPDTDFTRIGSRIRPTGIAAKLRLNQLLHLLQQPCVGGITIQSIENLTPKKAVPKPLFWSIQARFAIQVENETTGMQRFENRLLLIRAPTEEEAKQKLLRSFEVYAEPYLNSAGLLVRWQFEAFTDSYCLDINSSEELLSEQGVEIFSTLGKRRLRLGMGWKPNL